MKTLVYKPLEGQMVQCGICSHFCKIEEGRRGICGVRENRSGVLESLVYPKIIARSIDPIEKKPLYHVKPGSFSYSVATVGCNFKCDFCQNSDIAQMPSENGRLIRGVDIPPDEIVTQALRAQCESIAYTYTEPTVYFELAFETAKLAREKGLLNVFVTNGYMSREVLQMIGPFLDAANVDLKSFSDRFYRKYCKASLAPVKENLKLMKSMGVVVEVTTLLIPGLNDSDEELGDIAGFIANELGPEVPWHISRFHPAYRMTEPGRTPSETLTRAWQAGKDAGLYHVYVGNAPEIGREDTFCHSCGKVLVRRHAYEVEVAVGSETGECPSCGTRLYGVY